MFERFRRSGTTDDEAGGGVAVAERDRETVREREAAALREHGSDAAFAPDRTVPVHDGPETGDDRTAVAPAATAAPPRTVTGADPLVRRERLTPVVATDTMAAVRERQRMQFGGVSWGAAFFGFLSATGLATLLTALLVAAGVAIGLTEVKDAAGNAKTIGLGGGILLLVVMAIAWYCGGYVAGRMARFDGARQGVAVWAWTLVCALVVAAGAAIGGSQYNIFDRLNLPRIPTKGETFTTGGAIALAAAAVVTLLSAILGGKVGDRFHRRVDRVASDDHVVEP